MASRAEKAMKALGAKWSPNFDDYASGKIPASKLVCVKCEKSPCKCTQCPVDHRGSPCGFSYAPGESCPRGH
jgi:hypothetical protein